MIKNDIFFDSLKNNSIDFFSGVPDSLLKDFCAYLTDNTTSKEHIITANEGAAVAFASGYHLATNKVPLIYLQNSGLGNTINPLLSLADPEVYSIPMIVMVGWRGEPGIQDEPQHRKQGRVQNSILDAIEMPYFKLNNGVNDVSEFVSKTVAKAKEINGPVAIVVSKNTFAPYKLLDDKVSEYALTREEAISFVLDKLSSDDIVVSTTGKPSREVYEYRVHNKEGHQNDFLTVGSMGHSSQIALGVAMNSNRNVFCLDGDGSVIMHMGSLGVIGANAPDNFKHIILNNGAHDSVGGQPTIAFDISIPSIAKACGYNQVFTSSSKDELSNRFQEFLNAKGPSLLEIKVKKGARKDLGRPKSTPAENKKELMKLLTTD